MEAWPSGTCERCLEYFSRVKVRRVLEQYLFLKYDMSDLKRKRMVSRAWGAAWFKYLFYDTPLFDGFSIAVNYGLPVPPNAIMPIQKSDGIESNLAVWEIIVRLYSDRPELFINVQEEIISPKDMGLIKKSVIGELSEGDVDGLIENIEKMIEARLNKMELEGTSEPWMFDASEINEAPRSEGITSVISARSNIQSLNRFSNIERTSGHKDKNSGMRIDSIEGDQSPCLPDLEFDKKKQLSKVIEEMVNNKSESSSIENGEEIEVEEKINEDSNMNLVSNYILGTRMNTVSVYERGTSDYVSSEVAIRNFKQKKAILREMNRSPERGTDIMSEKRSLRPFGEKEADESSPILERDNLPDPISIFRNSSKHVTETE